jgi:hypothetical protein
MDKNAVVGKKHIRNARIGKKYHTIQWLTQVLEKRPAMWFIHSGHISLMEADQEYPASSPRGYNCLIHMGKYGGINFNRQGKFCYPGAT